MLLFEVIVVQAAKNLELYNGIFQKHGTEIKLKEKK